MAHNYSQPSVQPQQPHAPVQYQQAPYAQEELATHTYIQPFDYAAIPWPINYSYSSPEYVLPQQAAGAHYGHSPNDGIPLHAPIPVSGYSTLLASGPGNMEPDDTPFASPAYAVHDEETKPHPEDELNPLDVYLHAPRDYFPTPSELLMDPNPRERQAREGSEVTCKATSKSQTSSAALAEPKPDSDDAENLNQRKAYFRSVSDSVGFTITDPDTITSHDKKRCYLECLEEYVQWLHERLRLAGQEPPPLERISTYRGLKSRSIRTMLVHKQEDARVFNQHKRSEEQKFMNLQNTILVQQVTEESVHARRHSVAMGAIPDVIPSCSQSGRPQHAA
ncbi:hypothetical protein BC628DRAFT_1416191 [Trametes gibbosa]|nr:hypothetical protein BC628DRAFT_1416191 [Trametes gibbosa]